MSGARPLVNVRDRGLAPTVAVRRSLCHQSSGSACRETGPDSSWEQSACYRQQQRSAAMYARIALTEGPVVTQGSKGCDKS